MNIFPLPCCTLYCRCSLIYASHLFIHYSFLPSWFLTVALLLPLNSFLSLSLPTYVLCSAKLLFPFSRSSTSLGSALFFFFLVLFCLKLCIFFYHYALFVTLLQAISLPMLCIGKGSKLRNYSIKEI